MRLRQMRVGRQYEGGELGDEGTEDKLMVWDLYIPCALHDCHNAVKWTWLGMLKNERQTLRDVYAMVDAIRSAFGQIMCSLSGWVGRKLLIVDDLEALPTPAALRELWEVIGVPEEAVSEIADELRLHWADGFLRVAASAVRPTENLVDKVSNVLLAMWKYRKLSDSRWCSVGRSCRHLCGGLLSGLGDLTMEIIADENQSS